MRCSMCGHESPGGSSFCLNCGSSLAKTPLAQSGLPSIIVCAVCRGENPPGMKFCRSCGTALSPTGAGSPAYPPPGQLGPMPGIPAGPLGGPVAPMRVAPYGPGLAPEPAPMAPPLALGMAPTSFAAPALRSQGSTIACPRCGTQTPLGFAYCQQCGFHMQVAPASELPTVRPRPPSVAPPHGAPVGPMHDGPIDPHAGTLAQDDRAVIALVAPAAASWGTAVLGNRDGSDGQRFALGGEYLVFGRAGADIAFDDDRFLARQHARIERGADGAIKIVALDTLNGVFRKADAPVELADGSIILIGREVLRYERLEAEEVKVQPLVRHGVALFGSPPRDPWGRLIQLIPSGGQRDIRHLAGDEVVLGREEGDIVFRDDAFMSRRHAAVTWDGRRALLTDLGSSNGTFLRITGPTALRHGDHIRMGDQLLRLELGR
jgi:ribosomal protein L40E